ncbi:sulfite exporter TauE/SafE family protein [Candidatus Peregrinibacteria bacterium]|nr:sulfite exporter TauE/SafE family protein [Candidatus Peregrinibacteria bacterium]
MSSSKQSSPSSAEATAGRHRQVFPIRGMTCRSCELLIERKLKAIPGVTEVRASERRGEVEVFSRQELPPPSREAITEALQGTRYGVVLPGSSLVADIPVRGASRWFEVGAMLIVILALYKIFKATGLFSLSGSVEGTMTYGAIVAVGLTAATSTCLAVVGGLLLSVSAKWTENFHPVTRAEKFRPLLTFNVGRLLGYFLFGGLVGLLGTALTLTPRVTGYLTVFIAFVMIMLGLNILRIVPKRYCTLPLPRSFSRKIQDLSESKNPAMPAVLGALTFFLPCGFTQSMQLLALGSGSFFEGGMIMFLFALGTLPALLGISVVSSMAEGKFARYFLTFSGALVLILGILNLQSGLLLSGVDAQEWISGFAAGREQMIPKAGADPFVTINEQGQQIVTMYVNERGYSPDSFTIEPGRPTWIYAIAKNGVVGCASVMTAPTFNVSTPIKKGPNWLGPIQNPKNDFVVTCSMGMLRANVHIRDS